MNRFEFYKELYYKEVERKKELDDSINTPITIVVAFITAIYFLATSFDYRVNQFLSGIFILLSAATLVFLGFAIYHILVVYNNLHGGHKYSFYPFASELNKYNEGLIKYYEEKTQQEEKLLIDEKSVNELKQPKEEGNKDFEEYLIENTIKHIDHNTVTNDSRSLSLYKAKKFLFFALLLLVTLMVPFGINFFEKPESSTKFEIINPNSLIMPREQTIQKPQPPKDRIIKEGEQRPKPNR